jgi:tripartite-type tricarboxylate transporter receptor subunit TctC
MKHDRLAGAAAHEYGGYANLFHSIHSWHTTHCTGQAYTDGNARGHSGKLHNVESRRKNMRRIFTAIAFACLCSVTIAQTYPAKPVRFIVAFPAGGGNDVLARLVAQKLSAAYGQQFIVDNRTGAGGTIGAELAARSPADGYTLFLAAVATHAINPNLQRNLPYDPVRDFDPVCLMASAALVLAVHPSLPVRSVPQLVALAKARPGAINYASSGNGSSAQLAAELFKSMTHTNLQHVPYKGIAQGLNDLLGGHVQVIFNTAAALLPHVKSGRLRALAVTTAKRVPALPDLPTIAESGVPGYQTGSWWGIVVPAGTPRPIIDSLNREIINALRGPEISARLNAEAVLPIGSTPEEFAAHIRDELARLGKVIREAHIATE